jgi:hypothetical protein
LINNEFATNITEEQIKELEDYNNSYRTEEENKYCSPNVHVYDDNYMFIEGNKLLSKFEDIDQYQKVLNEMQAELDWEKNNMTKASNEREDFDGPRWRHHLG